MAAQYYGKTIFKDATFADLKRPDAPMVLINATDLPDGLRVSFNDLLFQLICTDLDTFPVSRAVTASSAVPVLFNPIILKNYAGTCGFEPPPWAQAAARQDKDTFARDLARAYLLLGDRKKRPFLHLVDGGISDNLGLRAIYTMMKLVGNPKEAFRLMGHPDVRQVLIISVNSQTTSTPSWAFELAPPGIFDVLDSITSDQIAEHTADTLEAVRLNFGEWAKTASTPDKPVTFHFVEVSFEKAASEAERRQLNDIGTSFSLKSEEVDLLISAAGKILRRSPEFRAFLEANKNP
jgi:NTE family protein